MAQAAALAALEDDEHMLKTRRLNDEGLAFWQGAFEERGLKYVPSLANFVLVEVGDGDALFREMLHRGVIVRAMRSYKLPGWVRISTGTAEQNLRALQVFDEALQVVRLAAGMPA